LELSTKLILSANYLRGGLMGLYIREKCCQALLPVTSSWIFTV